LRDVGCYNVVISRNESTSLLFAKKATAHKVNSYTAHSPFPTAHFVSENTLF